MRAIVFTNFRESVAGICEALQQHDPLVKARWSGRARCGAGRVLAGGRGGRGAAPRASPQAGACQHPYPAPGHRAFIGQGTGSKKGGGTGMTQKEQKEVLAGFK